MKIVSNIGLEIPDVLLPSPGIDPQKWAVIACDQFTSEPEYWEEVEKLVGDAPSTLRLTLPEVYLESPQKDFLAQAAQKKMEEYLQKGYLQAVEGLILVERNINGGVRRGLMVALDLERYDYSKGSQSLIRATEGTIIERLPPRMKIREGASLELPHILVLIDDPQKTVIEPVAAQSSSLKKLYDFELMFDSGHLTGYLVEDPTLQAQVITAITNLADPSVFQTKYGLSEQQDVLLFAMGDGNHSLATAKAIWEKIKSQVGLDHPARYALVELENLHDDNLVFEPIHRVLFNVKQDFKSAMQAEFGNCFTYQPCAGQAEMVSAVSNQPDEAHVIGVVDEQGFGLVRISDPEFNLPVGTLQKFLDGWIKSNGASSIDYVHGADVVTKLGSQPGNLGFFLPAMDKSDLFKTVILDGALPRKTFSMGEAKEKRFYMECRKITS
jgi:hypothetical protein